MAHGAEVELQGRPLPRIRTSLAYTYTSTQILNQPFAFDPLLMKGQPLLRRPKHSATALINYLGRRWGADLNGSFVGRRADSDFLGFGITHAPGYVLVNAGVQYVLPAAAVAASPRPASDAIALVLGGLGASVVSAGMALSMLVTLNGTTMSGARVPFAAARDGYFFPSVARVHPRFLTPSTAILLQLGLAVTLLLVGQNFRQLFTLAIFAEWLFYMITASTVFVFRKREPNTVRPYRVWGYPVVPALFVLAAAVLLYNIFIQSLHKGGSESSGILAGMPLVILAGVPVFYHFRRQRLV